MRRAARTDAPHAAIVSALRRRGWFVLDCSRLGNGAPDLLIARGGRLHPVEVKDGSKPPSRRKLTPREADVHSGFLLAGVDVLVIGSVEEATKL